MQWENRYLVKSISGIIITDYPVSQYNKHYEFTKTCSSSTKANKATGISLIRLYDSQNRKKLQGEKYY